jgi:endonuclease/exonuclease/phosphatase (EEP) superfamily protein YafD
MTREAAPSVPDPEPGKSNRWREFLRVRIRPWGILTSIGALSGVGTVAGLLGCLWWPLDLASHFRVQYLFSLLLLSAILAIARKRWSSLILAALAGPNLILILPLYIPPWSPEDAVSTPLRAMLANVNTRHGDPARVLRVVEAHDPDLLVLEEINAEWIERLGPLEEGYPHRITEPRRDNFGIGIYSKIPLESAAIVYIAEAMVPSIVAAVTVEKRTLHIFATHPPPPGGPNGSYWRDDHLAAVPDFLSEVPRPLLLLGDLNATPWSCHFQRLIDRSGLRDSTRGWGFQPTWPAGMPHLWIPIDHCLYSHGIHIRDRQVGPNVGSDHYPLIVEFVLTR